jgi:adenylate cyclase
MLRFYRVQRTTFQPENFCRYAFEALKQACRKEPECGLVWSMLARLYSLNYSLELFDLKRPWKKPVLFAERGVKLEPANQRARLIMAFIRLFEK